MAGLALLSTATMLSHLVAFGALCVGVAALALTSDSRRRAIGLAVAGLALPLALLLLLVVGASLAETARYHWRFRRSRTSS